MKKIIYVLILIFACISCKKEKEICYECITTVNKTVIKYSGSIAGTRYTRTSLCDVTLEEIDAYRRKESGASTIVVDTVFTLVDYSTSVSTIIPDTIITSINYSTRCNKK